MKYKAFQRSAFVVLFFLLLVLAANAQNQMTADEDFNLNITEERVTETNYERSTKVEIADGRKSLSVGVGAAVGAQRITLTLRGITGSVRFRASLEKISRLIEDRGGTSRSNEP